MKFNLLKNAGKVLRFIIECAPEDDTDYINSSDDDCWDDEVDAGKTYQNGLDGAQRVPGKTFY